MRGAKRGNAAQPGYAADDGVGLPDDVSESGLRNARRRADDLGGSLEVARVGERGTVLTWRVPLG